MGCDIHMRAEIYRAAGWELADVEVYDWRNYDLFAILADVRNGYGFAGVPTGVGFEPIAPPRGIPDDCHPLTREFLESYGMDGHSHSWHTLADLAAYDWERTTMKCGVVSADEYEKLAGKPPRSYCQGILGRGIVTFTPEGYEEWKARGRPDVGTDEVGGGLRHGDDGSGVIERPLLAGGEVKPYVRMSWPATYRECVGVEWWEAMAKLPALSAGEPERVRIVFFFDN